MEVLLNYNWNVYKVFKNGRRAKTPFHVFEHDNPETADEHYDENGNSVTLTVYGASKWDHLTFSAENNGNYLKVKPTAYGFQFIN